MLVDALTQHHEDRNNAAVAGYTLNQTAPKTAVESNILTITFYDDYTFSKAGHFTFDNSIVASFNANVKGQVTGSRVRMLLGNGAQGGFLTNVVYYDAEYRPVQSTRDLYDLGAGRYQRHTRVYKYDLAATLESEEIMHWHSASEKYVLARSLNYDHADRLLSVTEHIKTPLDDITALTASYRYNTSGSLKSKWFYNVVANKYQLRTDYTHNIRGWLTDGKTVYKKDEVGPDKTFFGFGLTYANGNNYTNGNISQMQWMKKDDAAFTKGLSFSYDGANRLTGSTGLNGYVNTESGITYDKNGNLKTLFRAGAAVDNLTYSYTGNRLSAVSDASGSNLGVKNGASSYAYDNNGNMTADGNRNAAITYNYLNLPKTVTMKGKTQVYDYDAAGGKHKYVSDTLILKYEGPFEYRQVGANNILYRVSLSEGQAKLKNGTAQFEYYLKDHLGNVRVVFDQLGAIKQQTDYYPFGLSVSADPAGVTPAMRNGNNRYLYNEKELQVGSGYLDYGARLYMPEIGRMSTVDGAANLFESASPYSYALNNPLLNIDPSGDTTFSVNDLARNWKKYNEKQDNVNLSEVNVIRPGYQKQLDQMYFQDYQNFSPWLPDAYGIQVNASASGIFGEAGFSAGVAMDSRGIAPFVSVGMGAGLAPPGIDFSLQFTMSERVNRSIPHKNLEFVKGAENGFSFGVGAILSRSQSALNNKLNIHDPNGYRTYGIGLGFGFPLGYKKTYSYSASHELNISK